MVQAFEVREAVAATIFPSDIFGDDVLIQTDTLIPSATLIFDWFE